MRPYLTAFNLLRCIFLSAGVKKNEDVDGYHNCLIRGGICIKKKVAYGCLHKFMNEWHAITR